MCRLDISMGIPKHIIELSEAANHCRRLLLGIPLSIAIVCFSHVIFCKCTFYLPFYLQYILKQDIFNDTSCNIT